MNTIAMNTITFIKEEEGQRIPSFKVNFSSFAGNHPSNHERNPSITYKIFTFIPAIFQSFATNIIKVFKKAHISFKIIVFEDFNGKFAIPENLFVTAFKIARWAFTLLFGIVDLSLSDLSKKFFTKKTLQHPSELNTSHIRTSRSHIDTSSIDPSVSISDLLTFWDEINFEDRSKPGYMPPTSRIDFKTEVKAEDLKKHLETFIDNVNKRTPIMGAPPAYDTEKLLAFYEQIEDAIRSSIHTIKSQEQQFYAKNGKDNSGYSEHIKQEYITILENKAKIALDIAKAGIYCGSRYTGEAMETYNYFCSDTHLPIGSLKDTIEDILANKRLEIAKQHILQFMNDNTHSYGTYMSNLGEILALPGMGNIIEHLSTPFNKEKMLQHFFEEYNEDLIIDTIQTKFETSQEFREKIYDWIKEQLGNWNEKDPLATQRIKETIETCIAKNSSDSNTSDIDELIEYLKQKQDELIEYLKQKQDELPQLNGNWQEFIDEIFLLPIARSWRDEKYEDLFPLDKMTRFQQIKDYCLIGTQSLETLPAQLDLPEVFESIKIAFKKGRLVHQISSIVRLEEATIIRGLEKPEIFDDAIPTLIDRERGNDFLQHFGSHLLDENKNYKISKELMEWILVSQGILNVQQGSVL
jgi:hypothetical protein